jgi:hypothetical protein
MELLLMATSTGLTKHSRILIYGDVHRHDVGHAAKPIFISFEVFIDVELILTG